MIPALDTAAGPVRGGIGGRAEMAALLVGGKDHMSADLPPNSTSPTPDPEHVAASEAPVQVRAFEPHPEAVVLTVGGQLDARIALFHLGRGGCRV